MEALVFVIFTPRSLWLLHDNMFPVKCTKSVKDIPSGSELILDLFPVCSSDTPVSDTVKMCM